jgi:Flp pilus assembly protein TadG
VIVLRRDAPGAGPVIRHRRGIGSRAGSRGQALIEFAMIVPLFMLLLNGMLEFGFIFEHNMTLEYATREGARVGAALVSGTTPIGCTTSQPNWQNVDPLVIAAVQRVLTSPGSEVVVSRVSQITIFKATSTGADSGTHNVWVYNASGTVKAPCAPSSDPALVFSDSSYPDGDAWKASARSNTSPSIDAIGVKLTYTYQFQTPLATILSFFGGGGNPTMTLNDQSIMVANPTT